MSDYTKLSEERLREIIEEAMYSKEPQMKITALVCEDERGWIPMEESKMFDRAMKQYVRNYQVGEKVVIKNLKIPDRHYYTITKIEHQDFHLRRYTKSGEVTTKTTIENIRRYEKVTK